MNYRIALSPELPLDTQESVIFWNETEACRTLAEARVSTAQPKGFSLDPALLQQGLILLVGAAVVLPDNLALQKVLETEIAHALGGTKTCGKKLCDFGVKPRLLA